MREVHLPESAVFRWMELQDVHVSEIEDHILGKAVSWGNPSGDLDDVRQSRGIVQAVIVRPGPVWSVEVEQETEYGAARQVVPLGAIYNAWTP